MGELIAVGLGESHVTVREHQVLVCYGLGSCIGLVLYDQVTHVGAMAHVVLPDSALNPGRKPQAPAKYADTAVPHLIRELVKVGAGPSRLSARIVGGARMLGLRAGGKLDIGLRNCEAVRVALKEQGVPLVAEDVGGTYGRTVQFFVGSGRMQISTVGRGERVL